MKRVIMYLMRDEKPVRVSIAGVPQMGDEDMIRYVKEHQLFTKHLRLFERPSSFKVISVVS